MITLDSIKKSAAESAGLVKQIREQLHQHPELSFHEEKTAAFICEKLDAWKIPYKANIAGNGILAWIDSRKPGKSVAIRADIDALPIVEQNEVEYISENKGVMHACGHDVHTASLLGTLYLLNQLKDEFTGKIYGIFQPAEEKLPGGAQAMLNSPEFQKLHFDVVLAQHVEPNLPAGKIGVRRGKYMASTDEIYVTLKGKGGHAATPHQITDTVLIASNIIVALQQIVSRKANATIPSVLSFGKFIANGATNIIPDEVYLEGTFRTMNEEWRKEALHTIKSMIEDMAHTMGAEVDVHIVNGYPALENNPVLTQKIADFAQEYLGKENVEELTLRMTAEDFSYFAQRYPSVMYRLGTGEKNKDFYPLHSARFNVNDDIFTLSHGLLTWFAVKLLE
jgi:amidohydrolase